MKNCGNAVEIMRTINIPLMQQYDDIPNCIYCLGILSSRPSKAG